MFWLALQLSPVPAGYIPTVPTNSEKLSDYYNRVVFARGNEIVVRSNLCQTITFDFKELQGAEPLSYKNGTRFSFTLPRGSGLPCGTGELWSFVGGIDQGGLYYCDKNSKEIEPLNTRPIYAFGILGEKVYAIQIRGCLGVTCDLLRFSRVKDRWVMDQEVTVTDIDAPSAVAWAKDRFLAYDYQQKVIQEIDLTGKRKNIASFDFDYPVESVARTDNGTLWIGGRAYIARYNHTLKPPKWEFFCKEYVGQLTFIPRINFDSR